MFWIWLMSTTWKSNVLLVNLIITRSYHCGVSDYAIYYALSAFLLCQTVDHDKNEGEDREVFKSRVCTLDLSLCAFSPSVLGSLYEPGQVRHMARLHGPQSLSLITQWSKLRGAVKSVASGGMHHRWMW